MFNELESALKLLQEGLIKPKLFNKNIFLLIKYYKYRGYDKQRNKEILLEWILSQDLNKIDKTNVQVIKIIDNILQRIYEHNYAFTDRIEIPITLFEMQQINNLKTKSCKLLAFIMIVLSKIYKNKDNVFYFTYNNFSKLSKLSVRNVKYIINQLEYFGFINIVERNEIKTIIKNNYKYDIYKKPNKYKVLIKEDDNIIYIINNENKLIEDFKNIYDICINKYNFKTTRYFKEFIRKKTVGG